MRNALHLDMRYSTSFMIALLCIIFRYGSQTYAFSTSSGLADHLLFHFCHANVFHMLVNLLTLFIFRPRISTSIVAYVFATLVSYMPFVAHDIPTMGLSAFLFAAYARKFYFHSINPARLIILQIAFLPVPGVNWIIHIVSFSAAYLCWALLDAYRIAKFYHVI